MGGAADFTTGAVFVPLKEQPPPEQPGEPAGEKEGWVSDALASCCLLSAYPCAVILENLLSLLESQFSHLYNGGSNNTYFT